MVSRIHPTAVVAEGAELGVEVEIGPYTVVGPTVRIGDRTRIGPQVVLDGVTALGSDNLIVGQASLGGAPQDLSYRGEPTASAYSASKGALIALGRAIAVEGARRDVLTNVLLLLMP